jgi:hypothetical protein
MIWNKSIKNVVSNRLLLTVIIVFLGIVLVGGAIMATKNSLVADDYLFLQPDFPLLSHLYNDDSGRVSHAIMMTVFRNIFGVYAVNILAMLTIVALTGAIFFLFKQLVANRIIKTSKKNLLVLSLIIGSLFLVILYSYYDFDLFFTAAATHSLTLIYAILLAGLYLKIRATPPHYCIWWSILLCIVTAFCSMLSEMAAVIGVIFGVCLIICYLYKTGRDLRQQLLTPIFAIGLSIIGFLVVYFSPGSTNRRLGNSHYDFIYVAKGAIMDYFNMFTDIILSPKIFAVVLASIIFYLFCKKIAIKDHKKALLAASLLAAFPAIIFLVTNYSIGYTAMRLFNLADLFLFSAMIVLGFVVLSKINVKNNWLTNISSLLFVMTIIVYATSIFLPITCAENMRNDILRERSAIINATKNNSSVNVLPAPLLLEKTEAIDMTFYPDENQFGLWNSHSIYSYYGVSGKNIRILQQPEYYCVDQDVYDRTNQILAKKCGSY